MATHRFALEIEVNEDELPVDYITGSYLPADVNVWTLDELRLALATPSVVTKATLVDDYAR